MPARRRGSPRWRLLSLVVLVLGAPWLCAASGSEGVCGPCEAERCAAPAGGCAAPELTARDECGCCERCLSAEGERCGGGARSGGAPRRCGPGLVCVSQRGDGRAEEPPEEAGSGRCVCKEDGAVCGSDGRSYGSVCALHLHNWRREQKQKQERVRKVHDGECKLGESTQEPAGRDGRGCWRLAGADADADSRFPKLPTDAAAGS